MKKKIVYFSIVLLLLSQYTKAQTWLWGKGMYASQNNWDNWCIVAQDNSNNIFLSGYYADTLIIQSDTLVDPYSSSPNSFFLKTDQNGNVQWIQQPGSGNLIMGPIIPDKLDNIYGVGVFGGSLTIGASSLYTNGSDFVLMKFDTKGNGIWAQQSLGSNGGNSGANAITSDKAGNIYATGEFTATETFDTSTISIPSGAGGGSYLVKYDSSGHLRWLRQGIIPPYNASKNHAVSTSYCVTVDKYGSPYIGGSFQDTVIFGKDTLTTKTGAFYLVKYDSTGKELWARQSIPVGDGTGGNTMGVTTDVSGNVYITGQICDTEALGKYLLFGPNLPTSRNVFLAKYSSSGNLIWAKNAMFNFKAAAGWSGYQLATDSLNHIFMSGGNETNVIDTIQFDSIKLISPGKSSGIIVEFDTSGKALCGSIVAGAGIDPNSLSVDEYANHVYFAGILNSKADFNSDTVGPRPLSKSKEPFFARWQPCEYGGEQGIDELPLINSSCKVFPNPSNGRFTIRVSDNQLMGDSRILLYNVIGQQITDIKWLSLNNSTQVDLSNEPAGIYLYRVTSEKGDLVGSGKLLIVK